MPLALLAVAAAAAPAPAAACVAADDLPGWAGAGPAGLATVCLINAERRVRGMPAVHADARLALAARRHSRDMARRKFFSHTTPDGSAFVSRIRRSGYMRRSRRWRVGQILAWGTGAGASPRAVVSAWMESPPHREVLLRPYYREVGIGVVPAVPARGRRGGATYTTDFGVKEAIDAR
jgi:uncharacterized protein YkwD